jgi:hypothetical protein
VLCQWRLLLLFSRASGRAASAGTRKGGAN